MSDDDAVEPVEAAASCDEGTEAGQDVTADGTDEMRPSGGGTWDTKGNGSAG